MAMLGNYRFDNLNDLFVQQLEDLYDSEQRLIKALPKMAGAAHTPELKQAFQEHLEKTKGHAQRLEGVFNRIGQKPQRETSPAMKGLIEEGSDMANAKGDKATLDAALIAAAQRVEHYEIAGYGCARTFAQRLGFTDVAQTLQQILSEEGEADKRLTQIAESAINVQATH